jgi:integrase
MSAKYKRKMKDGIEERISYATGKRSFFVPIPSGSRQKWHKVPAPQTWAHARQYKRRILADIDKGEYVDRDKRALPLVDFCQRWWTARQPELRVNSQKAYRWQIDQLILPYLGHIALGKLTPEHIQTWKVNLLVKEFSPTTIRAAINLLRQILNRAVDWQYLFRNVAKMIDLPPEVSTKVPVWNEDEIHRFLSHLSPEWVCLFKVPLLTGLRLGELQGMREVYLNLDGATYYVKEQYSGTTQTFGPPKTAESVAPVSVPPSLLADLQTQLQSVREAKLRATFWCDDYDLIFPTHRGMPISVSTIQRMLTLTIKAADVPRLTFHGLRHTFVSQLIAQGENVKVIQRKARHKDVQMTLNKYGHLFPDDSEAAGSRLDQRLFG